MDWIGTSGFTIRTVLIRDWTIICRWRYILEEIERRRVRLPLPPGRRRASNKKGGSTHRIITLFYVKNCPNNGGRLIYRAISHGIACTCPPSRKSVDNRTSTLLLSTRGRPYGSVLPLAEELALPLVRSASFLTCRCPAIYHRRSNNSPPRWGNHQR